MGLVGRGRRVRGMFDVVGGMRVVVVHRVRLVVMTGGCNVD